MKIKAALLSLTMIFGLALGFAGQASADPTAQCDILNVIVEGGGEGWFVKANSCRHGKASRVQDKWILLEPVDELALYGPDCEIVIYKQDADASDNIGYVYRVGQGICHAKLKAGKIHVEHLSGKPAQYVVKKGSFGQGVSGSVTFTLP
ncbi:MAG: hypothetical protein KQH53_08460 [Desulfarculaceae bacterium]|nr:hypothetical protein [Desulfarculaceae bacterium]